MSDKGLVLTAAHVLNPPAADSKVSVQHFERISLYDAGAKRRRSILHWAFDTPATIPTLVLRIMGTTSASC